MARRTPIVWRNLTHRKVRAMVALSGVCFSVLLVFMQLGFYSAVLTAATAVYRQMDADVFLISPLYVYLGRTGSVPRARMFQAEGVSGVREGVPFFVDTVVWRNPETRLRHPMLLMAFDPAADLLPLTHSASRRLENGQLLIDSLTRPHYGPQTSGTVTELGGRRVEIVGQYTIGPGFATDGAAITDDETFLRVSEGSSAERPSVIALRTTPGASVAAVVAALRATLPTDAQVLSREELILREEDYWATQTSIGPVFAAGALLGLVIGVVIVYQVMVTDIAKHMREYATLKALGYDGRRLQAIVLKEVTAFSVVGFAVGCAMSGWLYYLVRDATGLPMSMPVARAATIFVLTVLMCWIAGLMATRKLHKANPAELF